MDSGKAVGTGVTVIAPGASSSYHVASRTDSMGSGAMLMDSSAMHAGSERKKRGRPRKYKANESADGVFSPPLSTAAPSSSGKSCAGEKRPNLEQPSSSEKKHRNKIGAENLDNLVDCFTGSSFLPHVIAVNCGEDISTKIMEFSLQGPRTVCVLSSYGTVSSATIRHPNSSGGILTYEGLFDILSFSGSFSPAEMPSSKVSRSGTLKISLAGADGRVVGGIVAGLTIAATPVKVVVVSFLLSPLALQTKKQNAETASGVNATGEDAVDLEKRGRESPQTLSENPTNRATMDRPRKSAADINISLQG